jgi:hypothetical protein
MRILLVTLVTGVALSLAVTLAVAAPGALSPDRGAAAAEYCPPEELDARDQAVDAARAKVTKGQASLAKYRASQLKARAKYFSKTRNQRARSSYVKAQDTAYKAQVAKLNRWKADLRAAQARLGRCD